MNLVPHIGKHKLPTINGSERVRVRVSKLDEIEEENHVTQRDVIRELSS